MRRPPRTLTASLFADRSLARADQLLPFRLRRPWCTCARCVPDAGGDGGAARAALRPADEPSSDPVTRCWRTGNRAAVRDAADHARHTAEGTNGLCGTCWRRRFETNLALADVPLNMIMKKLSRGRRSSRYGNPGPPLMG